MEIAVRGKYSLRHKAYIGDTKAGMKDIEIVCWKKDYTYTDKVNNGKNCCYTVATFEKYKDECCELKSCDDRLLESINNYNDVEDLRALEKIGSAIIMGDDEVACE